jgi:hypothetical protein
VTTSPADRIDLGPWTAREVQYSLAPADQGDQRAPGDAAPDLPADQLPQVSMPESAFDCVRLDALADHPAVDAVVRAELADGVPFRLIRFPFSLRAPVSGRLVEGRFTVQLRGETKETTPRVHSIFPERLRVDGDESTTEAAIEPKLAIGSIIDIGSARLGRTIVSRNARSVIVGFWSENGAEWVVRPLADGEQLEGSWEFLVIARWPHLVLPLRVTLSAAALVASEHRLTPWRTRRAQREYGPTELTGCLPIA